jgi:hypothetical protein
MKSIKTSISTRLAALLVGAALFGLVSQSALAAGTTAGTSISNSASLSYSVGTVAQTPINTTSAAFLVDEKVNLTVAGGVTTNVVPGSTAQATAFTVTNNSNSPLDFTLAVTSGIAGDNFDPTACSAFVDVNSNGTYEPLIDTATYIDEMPDSGAGSTQTVFAVCDIPPSAANTNTGLVGLVATARGNFTGANGIYVATVGSVGNALTETAGGDTVGSVDIVFADDASSAPGADDTVNAGHGVGIRNAAASARNTYSVLTAALTVTKTATLLCDPLNGLAVSGAKNIPGAMTQWAISVTNTGSAAATLTTITDTLSATLAMDPGQAAGLTVPTNAATCVAGPGTLGFEVTASAARNIGGAALVTTHYFTTANDADGVENNAGTVMATFATMLPADGGHATAGLLNAGETVTVIFNTIVQ